MILVMVTLSSSDLDFWCIRDIVLDYFRLHSGKNLLVGDVEVELQILYPRQKGETIARIIRELATNGRLDVVTRGIYRYKR